MSSGWNGMQETSSHSECAGRSGRREAAICGELMKADLKAVGAYCSSTSLPLAYSKRFSFDRKDRPSRFSDSASSGSTMASTSRTMRPPTSIMASRRARGLDGAVGGGDGRRCIRRARAQAETRGGFLVQGDHRSAGIDHEVDALAVDAAIGLEMTAGVARDARCCEPDGTGGGATLMRSFAQRSRAAAPASSGPPSAP